MRIHLGLTTVLLLAGCHSPQERLAEAMSFGGAYVPQLKAALDEGADPNKDGTLHKAVAWGDEGVVKVLLQYKADPNLPEALDYRHRLPLQIALEATRWEAQAKMVKVLLDGGADPNRNGVGPALLRTAIEQGSLVPEDSALLLLEKGAKFDDGTLSLALAQDGNRFTRTIDVLVAKGAKAGPVLAMALARGNRAVFDKLLEAGADLDAVCAGKPCERHTALAWAARMGDLETMKRLLDRGAKIDAPEGGLRPLHAAARAGKADAVKLLLERKADPKALDDSKATALHGAATEDVIRLLLAAGIPVDAGDKDDDTPLMWSLAYEVREPQKEGAPQAEDAGTPRLAAALFLLTQGAAFDRVDSQGQRPLHRALRLHDEEAVQALLALGAKAGAKDDEEKAPLVYLLETAHFFYDGSEHLAELAAALVKAGASANLRTSERVPLLALAVEQGDPALAAALLDGGADPASVERLVASTEKKVREQTGNPVAANLGWVEREIPDPDVAAAKTPRERVIAAAKGRSHNLREAENARLGASMARSDAAEQERRKDAADEKAREAREKARDKRRKAFDRCAAKGILKPHDLEECIRKSR